MPFTKAAQLTWKEVAALVRTEVLPMANVKLGHTPALLTMTPSTSFSSLSSFSSGSPRISRRLAATLPSACAAPLTSTLLPTLTAAHPPCENSVDAVVVTIRLSTDKRSVGQSPASDRTIPWTSVVLFVGFDGDG